MTGAAFSLFDTPIGAVAIVWRGERVVGTMLPEKSAEQLRERVGRRFAGAVESAPPLAVEKVIQSIVRLLEGEPVLFAPASLDLDGCSDFERRVYGAALAISAGRTMTYGEMAVSIGAPGAARAVGVALGRNPFPIIVPCHRILSAKGSGGFSAPGGVSTKMKLLAIERAGRGDEAGLFDYLPLVTAPIAGRSSRDATSD